MASCSDQGSSSGTGSAIHGVTRPGLVEVEVVAPLPTTTDTLPVLTDLSPLFLLDALRKVRTKIILARITLV